MTHRCRLHAYYTPTEGPAKRGDKVTFDSEGFRDGQPIPDSKTEKATIVLGTGKLTPAIERAFYGHNAGDHFEVEVTYPQDFQVPELSGVTAQFSIRLHAIAEKHIPAADEDFARSRGFDSLEAMKVQIRKEKQAIHETAADRKAGRDLLDMAGANLTVDLPEKQVAAEGPAGVPAAGRKAEKERHPHGRLLQELPHHPRGAARQLPQKCRKAAAQRAGRQGHFGGRRASWPTPTK